MCRTYILLTKSQLLLVLLCAQMFLLLLEIGDVQDYDAYTGNY